MTSIAPSATRITPKKTNGRSAVSNGARLFAQKVDGRTLWARRYRDLFNDFLRDAGGAEHLSQLKIELCRRAAALAAEAERMECDLAQGQKIDADLLARLSSHLRRIAETIGIERVKRDATPSLAQIIEHHARGEME